MKKKILKIKLNFGFLEFYSVLLMLYLVVPVIIIIIFSFNNSTAGVFPLAGFTFKWYVKLFENELLISSVKNSVYVASVTATVSVLVGVLASFALIRYKFKAKNLISFIVLIPISIPGILLGISLLSFFSSLNINKSLLTVIIGHAVFCIPFVVLVMNSRLEGFDIALEEAAKDLGANTLQTFRYITFPLIRPSLVGVIMLSFALSFDEFLVTFFTAGTKNTLPLIIWGMLRRGVSPAVNAVSTIVLVFSMVLIMLVNRMVKIRFKI